MNLQKGQIFRVGGKVYLCLNEAHKKKGAKIRLLWYCSGFPHHNEPEPPKIPNKEKPFLLTHSFPRQQIFFITKINLD